jgi:hypothetical protein
MYGKAKKSLNEQTRETLFGILNSIFILSYIHCIHFSANVRMKAIQTIFAYRSRMWFPIQKYV